MPESTTPAGGEIVLTITGRDIWEKLDRIEAQVSGVPAKVEDHESRIRVLERKVWGAAGAAAVFSAAGATAITKLLGG